jgi:hypothetical protein
MAFPLGIEENHKKSSVTVADLLVDILIWDQYEAEVLITQLQCLVYQMLFNIYSKLLCYHHSVALVMTLDLHVGIIITIAIIVLLSIMIIEFTIDYCMKLLCFIFLGGSRVWVS